MVGWKHTAVMASLCPLNDLLSAGSDALTFSLLMIPVGFPRVVSYMRMIPFNLKIE
jgi:hypothetical protein